MPPPPLPAKTQAARELLAGARSALPVPLRMLLINVDGRKTAAELQEIETALGLGSQGLATLQRKGLIAGLPRQHDNEAPLAAHPSSSAAPTVAARADAPAQADTEADLRRLMRAKMFAFDLACRMLAGRDAELRARARDVNSESKFLEWLAEASARIEAASDAERAQLFRERVAQAAA